MREGYKMTTLGEIPVDWEVVKLGEVSVNYDNLRKPLKSSDRQNMQGLFPYYGAQGIIDSINNYIFSGEYLLIAEDGENVKSRKYDIALIAKGQFWVNNHAHVILNNDKSNLVYLKYYINFMDIKPYVTGLAQPKLNKNALENLQISLPPLPEQQKIAEILSTVDAKIENISKQIQANKALKKGMMQRLLSKGIGHSAFKNSPLGEIPLGWKVVKIEDIADVTSSKRVHRADYTNLGIPFFRGKEITQLSKGEVLDNIVYIKEEKFNELKQKYGAPLMGDILISAVGTIGSIYLINNDNDFYFKDGNLIWLREISNKLNKKYLSQYLKSNVFQKIIDNISSGSSQKALTIVKFKKLNIPIPNFPEQQKIAEILSSMDAKIEVLEAKKVQYQELKKGLMQQLLTGKIRVNSYI
ncbi:restriction endonuclease subunit S [Aureivirga marina]|uniref:restriction endonuclease subunit S n=1 Tax=Aureivirga marina TaxID=1182451 RepID=UPI0018C97109|nr:restriction endonuclease subunit S [Aureivirga marina]